MNNLAKVIALGGRRLNRALAMHYLFSEQGIPKGYIPLDYIESTGTQCINTFFKPNQNTRVVCDFQFTEAPSAQWIVFGTRNGTSLTDSQYVFGYSNGFRIDYYQTRTFVNGTFDAIGRHTVDMNKNVTTFDGVVTTMPYGEFSTSYNLILLGMNTAGSVYCKNKTRIYSCQIYDDDVLVRDYKPCISPDGKVGLYDLVDRKFYGNNGTGEFIAGYGIDSYVHDGMISLADAECGLDGSTLKNLAGDNYDMTITGSLPYADKGLTFNGTTNNYINVPEFTELANTAELTCEMAMNLTNIQGTQRLLYLKDFFEFFVRSGKINSDLHLDGEPRENLQGNANTGFITFAAVFKANEFQKLFVNGVEAASTSAASPLSVPASGTIGGNGYALADGSKFYSMRVYNRALTNEEIAQNFEIDQARFVPTETASVMMLSDETDTEVMEDDTI